MSSPPNRKGLWLAGAALLLLLLVTGIVAFAPLDIAPIMGAVTALLFARWVFSHGKK